jgi:hypothetical protein
MPVRDADGAPDLHATMASAPALIENGVTDVRLYLAAPTGRAEATEYLRDVVSRFRAVVA